MKAKLVNVETINVTWKTGIGLNGKIKTFELGMSYFLSLSALPLCSRTF